MEFQSSLATSARGWQQLSRVTWKKDCFHNRAKRLQNLLHICGK